MASFSATFKAERDKKGPGKTFTWTDKNGKTETYSTNYAEEEKKPTGTKPKAKPAGLNPQSGASRSVTNKVKPTTSLAQQKTAYGANRSTSMDGVSRKPASSLSGASRSTAGKVKPQMSQTEKAMAAAKAAKAAKDAEAAKKKAAAATAVTTTRTPAKSPFKLLGEFLAGGGMSGADRRAKATKKALGARR